MSAGCNLIPPLASRVVRAQFMVGCRPVCCHSEFETVWQAGALSGLMTKKALWLLPEQKAATQEVQLSDTWSAKRPDDIRECNGSFLTLKPPDSISN
jgi:hypothetical protein